jgi:hypothetical protein
MKASTLAKLGSLCVLCICSWFFTSWLIALSHQGQAVADATKVKGNQAAVKNAVPVITIAEGTFDKMTVSVSHGQVAVDGQVTITDSRNKSGSCREFGGVLQTPHNPVVICRVMTMCPRGTGV